MSDIKKFLDLGGLTTYDSKIKQLISDETKPGKNADKAFRSFLGNPEGYPDENIPVYSETVNAAADAKAAAITAQNSATNSAAAAAASAEEAANILGTPEDESDDKTIYGLYSKVNDTVDNGLYDIDEAVNDGKRTLQDEVSVLCGNLDEYVETTTKPAIVDYVDKTTKPAIDGYVENTAKKAIDTYVNETVTSDINEYVNNEVTPNIEHATNAATAAIGIAQSDAEAAIATASGNAVDAVEGAQADAEAAIAADLTDAQSTIGGDLASAKQEIIEATITATNTISADLTAAKQDITNAKTAATNTISGDLEAAKSEIADAGSESLSAITEAADTGVGSINIAKTTALGEISAAVAPVTAAKNDAEAAKNAAKDAQAAAEAAANTATNAVTGFRAELGERNGEPDTVWGNIRTLKSSVQGGVHFKGVFERKPEVYMNDEGSIVSINDITGYDYWNTGDVIIISAGADTLQEPTKEYILATDGDSNPYWVELGDVSPADQKITALENNKLNKSALTATEDTIDDLNSHNTYALVELTADEKAIVRMDNILDTMIVAIPISDINGLFE